MQFSTSPHPRVKTRDKETDQGPGKHFHSMATVDHHHLLDGLLFSLPCKISVMHSLSTNTSSEGFKVTEYSRISAAGIHAQQLLQSLTNCDCTVMQKPRGRIERWEKSELARITEVIRYEPSQSSHRHCIRLPCVGGIHSIIHAAFIMLLLGSHFLDV